MKIKFQLPKLRLRSPFKNPVNLTVIHKRFFGKISGKQKRKLTWKLAGKIALWGFGSLAVIIIFMFAWFAKDLPTPGKIKSLASESSTRIYDRNMNELYTISGEKKRILIDSKDIPDVVKQATIALEDKDFYNHPGLDYKGLIRAVVYGGSRGGGSTLTQQYVKNALLKDGQRTITRKIKEAILSIELEMLYSKDQILTMYLNDTPYGGNNYGVEAASQAYFGKTAKDLTLAEAATLAALPQAPSRLSPYGQHTDKLITRRDFCLDQMVKVGYITDPQAIEAKKVALAVVPKRESITAPHFVLYVKDWLIDYFTKELGDEQRAEQKVESGGLTVVTTLDLEKQKKAEEIVSAAKDTSLKSAKASNAGLVSIDPKRGEVIAMVGSVDYYQEQFGAFNIATASRQPGSSFKPIVYATAFKDKYNPSTVLYDTKTDFGAGYTPNNFDGAFRGPVTIRQAIGNSLNIPAVKTAGLVGVEKIIATAKDMGITTLTTADQYGLSLALGSGEVRLIDMATAYGVFANGGVLMPTTPILKITDTSSKVLYSHEDPKDGVQVLDPQIAYEISNILSDTEAKKPVFSRTMSYLTLANNRPVASKTGTTNANHDAWTMGYTPQVVTGVWAGNNDNTPMNAGGSIAAAPIWDKYMEYANKDLPVEQFNRPDGIQEVQVDKLSNKLPVDGSDVITGIFARWQVPTENDNVHVKVRVCRENGLLADSNIADSLAEYRTYTNIHSEKPDNSSWENPVIAWATAAGLYNPPPTAKCTAANSVSPTVSITTPSSGSVLSGNFDIIASATAPSGVKQVDFLIDNTVIATDTDSPYQTSYSATNLASGNHTITATVTSTSGSTATTTINVSVNKDSTPPNNVTGLSGASGPGTGKVTLNWTNPGDSDFNSVKIYVYLDASMTFVKTIEIDKPISNTTISSLTSGVAYRFIAKATDYSGNESSGTFVILTPP